MSIEGKWTWTYGGNSDMKESASDSDSSGGTSSKDIDSLDRDFDRDDG